jgi:hypothetical protein
MSDVKRPGCGPIPLLANPCWHKIPISFKEKEGRQPTATKIFPASEKYLQKDMLL